MDGRRPLFRRRGSAFRRGKHAAVKARCAAAPCGGLQRPCSARWGAGGTARAHGLHGRRVRAGCGATMELTMVARLALGFLTVLLGTSIGAAQPVADFYRGKTVQLLIGYTVGGNYDLSARLLARHIGRHIPGNPTIVPQNMAGAGSLRL